MVRYFFTLTKVLFKKYETAQGMWENIHLESVQITDGTFR